MHCTPAGAAALAHILFAHVHPPPTNFVRGNLAAVWQSSNPVPSTLGATTAVFFMFFRFAGGPAVATTGGCAAAPLQAAGVAAATAADGAVPPLFLKKLINVGCWPPTVFAFLASGSTTTAVVLEFGLELAAVAVS